MSLRGAHLRVAAGLWVPFVTFDDHENGSFATSGLLMDFMNIFAEKLNFTFTIVKSVDGEWGRLLPNGSTTGMIGMCQRKEVDLALGPFSVTYQRSQIIDYSVPLYIDSFGIFLPRPRKERDLAGFVKPFAWEVWVSLLVLMALSMALGVVYNCLARRWCLPGALEGVSKDVKTFFHANWIFKTLLVEPIDLLPTSITGRVLLGTWMIVSLILSTAYQGILTSLLAVPKVEVPVDSLQDLLDYGKIPWSVEYGTSIHQLLDDSSSEVYKEINKEIFYVSSSFAERERVKKDRFAILCDFFSMRMIISDDYGETGECNYYIAKEVIWSASMAFAFPKGSSLTRHFDKWMVMMKESGLVDRYLQEVTKNATVCMVPPGKEGGHSTSTILSMDDLGGVFLIAAGGVTISFLVFLVELLLERWSR